MNARPEPHGVDDQVLFFRAEETHEIGGVEGRDDGEKEEVDLSEGVHGGFAGVGEALT